MSDLPIISCFIDGHDEIGKEVFEKHYPATGMVTAKVVESTSDMVDRAVAAARAALKGSWKATTFAERAALLNRLADAMEARLDDFVAEEIADTGKPVTPTTNVEIPRAIGNIRFFARMAGEMEKPPFTMSLAGGGHALNMVVRDPIGVVGIVAPWNLPLLLLTFKIAPALLCGNTVVVKPSEHSPRTALLLARVMLEVGFPKGVLNVVHGHGANAAGQYLTSHPGVDAITFTGETGTGEAIMRAAAAGVRPVSLELGGKNAALVFDDCDLDAAIAGTARSMFDNCGQVCLTTERIYVHRSIFEPFLAGVAAAARALRPGDPLDRNTTLGAAISDRQRKKVLDHYTRAAAAGATIVTGGDAIEMPAPFSAGYWVAPTIWTGLPDSAEICRSEVFGPCGHVSIFDDEDDVIARANSLDYGLAATVWSHDLDRARRIARRIEAGTVWINCWRVRDERAAFGGMKRSGIGREGGEWSLDFYSELKTICAFEAD